MTQFSIFTPTLTYQHQTCTLAKRLERKIATCDKNRNEKIREMAGTTPIQHHIDRQRIKWFGHLTRIDTNQLAHEAYNTRVSGYKTRGRQERQRQPEGTQPPPYYSFQTCG